MNGWTGFVALESQFDTISGHFLLHLLPTSNLCSFFGKTHFILSTHSFSLFDEDTQTVHALECTQKSQPFIRAQEFTKNISTVAFYL